MTTRLSVLGAAALASLVLGAVSVRAAPAPIVFFDIAGKDLGQQRAFYAAVFGWKIGPQGAMSVPVVSPLPGSLRADPPDKGLYIGVPDVTDALARVTAHGGAVIAPRFEVKGVVVIGLFKDPAGNSMGLVEMKDGKPVVP